MRSTLLHARRRRGLVLTALLAPALSGCANLSPAIWLRDPTPAPLVLRLAPDGGGVTNRALPAPGAVFAGNAASGTLGGLAYALPTLGLSLLAIPFGFAEGATEAKRAGECRARWQAAVGDPAKWLETTFAGFSTVAFVAEELARVLPAPQPALEQAPLVARDAANAQLRAIAQRLDRPVLAVADLRLTMEQSTKSRCGIRWVATAHLAGREIATLDTLSVPRVLAAAHEDPDASIEAWAQDPERAREEVRITLRQLAARLAQSYLKP